MLTSSDDVAALAVTTTDARLLTSSDDVAALKLRSKSLIHWVSWVCSYWAVRFREVGVLNHLVSLEEFSNDSMWTHCSIVSAYIIIALRVWITRRMLLLSSVFTHHGR